MSRSLTKGEGIILDILAEVDELDPASIAKELPRHSPAIFVAFSLPRNLMSLEK